MNSLLNEAIAYLVPLANYVKNETIHIEDLGNGLAVAYALDNDDGFSLVTKQQLSASGLSAEALHETGLANLGEKVDRQFRLHDSDPWYGIYIEPRFIASCMLIDNLWDQKLSTYVKNGFTIAVPRNCVLAFCDSRSEYGIDSLNSLISLELDQQDKLLSTSLYRRQRGRWVELKTDMAMLRQLAQQAFDLPAWGIRASQVFRDLMKKHKGIELHYDLDSIRWLDRYVETLHKDHSEHFKNEMRDPIAAFFGEAIRNKTGGRWEMSYRSPVIRMDNDNTLFPLSKVEKHLESGWEDGQSILGLYDMTHLVAPGPLPKRVQDMVSIYRQNKNSHLFLASRDGNEANWEQVQAIRHGQAVLSKSFSEQYQAFITSSSSLHEIRSFYLTSSTGELLASDGLTDKLVEKLPATIRQQLDPNKILKTSLTVPELVKGLKYISIEFAKTKYTEDHEKRYSIRLRNLSNEKIRILRFGEYREKNRVWTLNSCNFETEWHFQDKYAIPIEWLTSGEHAYRSDTSSDLPVMWVYHCETESGEQFIVGKILQYIPIILE